MEVAAGSDFDMVEVINGRAVLCLPVPLHWQPVAAKNSRLAKNSFVISGRIVITVSGVGFNPRDRKLRITNALSSSGT
jgi:hypothetical protein